MARHSATFKEAAEKKATAVREERKAARRAGRRYLPKYGLEEAPAEPAPELAVDGSGPAPTPATPPKPRKGNLHKFTSDGNLIDIWERRLVNPNVQESVPIKITTPGMLVRWINKAQAGRYHRARYVQGWQPVHKSELVDEHVLTGAAYTVEGWVCRGEKQSEVLMKIPAAIYRKIQERKTELRHKARARIRENMKIAAQAHVQERVSAEQGDKAGRAAGDQAVDAIGRFVGDVKFGTERATTDELFD